jgi:hypothetical protein
MIFPPHSDVCKVENKQTSDCRRTVRRGSTDKVQLIWFTCLVCMFFNFNLSHNDVTSQHAKMPPPSVIARNLYVQQQRGLPIVFFRVWKPSRTQEGTEP